MGPMERTGSHWYEWEFPVLERYGIDGASARLMRTPSDIIRNVREQTRGRRWMARWARMCVRCEHWTAAGTCGVDIAGLKEKGEDTRWAETFRPGHRCHHGLEVK